MVVNVSSEEKGMRLDKFVPVHFPDFSRTHIQEAIKKGEVRVNDKKVTPHHFLKEGDAVSMEIADPTVFTITPNAEVYFNVLEETPDYLIINKPAGLVVHQGGGHPTPDTLVNGLVGRYPEIVSIGPDPIRPGMVHRLDRDVSGVMVIARTQPMYDHLVAQFGNHTIQKEYTALVRGVPKAGSGVITAPIGRTNKTGTSIVDEEGKDAVTEYEVLKSWNSAALLKIVTKTGRMHQIRLHLAHIGHPILGDTIYGKTISKELHIKRETRLMLHATKLGFHDLQGQWREYHAILPVEFESFK